MKTTIDKDKLLKLRKQMKGLIHRCSKEIDVSPSMISRILSGDRSNLETLERIIQFRNKVFTERKEAIRRIDQSIKSF